MMIYNKNAKLPKCSNASCSREVANYMPFEGSNLWGDQYEAAYGATELAEIYAVFSYSKIIAFNYRGQWVKNAERHSITSSKHLTQATRGINFSHIFSGYSEIDAIMALINCQEDARLEWIALQESVNECLASRKTSTPFRL